MSQQQPSIVMEMARRCDAGLVVGAQSGRRMRAYLWGDQLILSLPAKPSEDWPAWNATFELPHPIAPFGMRADCQTPLEGWGRVPGPLTETFMLADESRMWVEYGGPASQPTADEDAAAWAILKSSAGGDWERTEVLPEPLRYLLPREGAAHQDVIKGFMSAVEPLTQLHPPGPVVQPCPMPHGAPQPWGAQATCRMGMLQPVNMIGAPAFTPFGALANLEVAIIRYAKKDNWLKHVLNSSV